MGRSDQVSWILKEENRRPTHQSRVLEEAIRRRPSEKSVRSMVSRVWSAEVGESGPAVDWTTLLSFNASIYTYDFIITIYICVRHVSSGRRYLVSNDTMSAILNPINMRHVNKK